MQVPVLGVVGEQKTKPTQHSVATLRSLGFAPHLLACRSQDPVAPSTREKLVRFCCSGESSTELRFAAPVGSSQPGLGHSQQLTLQTRAPPACPLHSQADYAPEAEYK